MQQSFKTYGEDRAPREIIKIGIGDLQVTKSPNALLVTHSLGSCVGVTVYDVGAKLGGLLHFMLPEPRDPSSKIANPFDFVTLGLPFMVEQLERMGGKKRDMRVCVAGGAQMMALLGEGQIGLRNGEMCRTVLSNLGMKIEQEMLGGSDARTLSLHLKTGRVFVKVRGEKVDLWRP